MSCPHSLVADGPLEADALLALEEALRVDLGLDRLEPREAVRAPHVRCSERRWSSAVVVVRAEIEPVFSYKRRALV